MVEPKDSVRIYETVVAAPPAARLGLGHVAGPAAPVAARRDRDRDGRRDRAAGAASAPVNHCIHGKDAIVEEVLDWQPVDYVTLRTLCRRRAFRSS